MQVRKLNWCPSDLLSRIRAAVRKLGKNWVDAFVESESFKAAMRALGFRKRYHTGAGCEEQWRSAKHKLILKCSGVCGSPIPVHAIPTLVLRTSSDREKLILQPLADASFVMSYKAHIAINTRARHMSERRARLLFGVDRHSGNTAFYNGRPVLIDW